MGVVYLIAQYWTDIGQHLTTIFIVEFVKSNTNKYEIQTNLPHRQQDCPGVELPQQEPCLLDEK